jgi:hypothetical protein
MIKKINTHKIEHQSNTSMFVWDCDNLIENKTETNYEDQFKINQMLKETMKRKRKKRIHSKEKNWKMRFF